MDSSLGEVTRRLTNIVKQNLINLSRKIIKLPIN
jgi:hypothetical protein